MHREFECLPTINTARNRSEYQASISVTALFEGGMYSYLQKSNPLLKKLDSRKYALITHVIASIANFEDTLAMYTDFMNFRIEYAPH